MTPAEPSLGDDELRALGDARPVIVDGLLGGPAALRALREAETHLGALHRAGVGRGGEHHVAPSLRGDSIAWLDAATCTPALALAAAALDRLVRATARAACLALLPDPPELQLARYAEPGARYARHRDTLRAFASALPPRRLSALYYLNPLWSPPLGGALRVYCDPPVDVAPLLDRALLFLATAEHEVLPIVGSWHRWALTAWYR